MRGGGRLGRGYHRRDELTAQRFCDHPRLGRIYRTGDLVRRNENGDLEYLGRMDGQVKLRGYRIELEAIDAHLAACPGVRAAACRVQGTGADQVLVAHIVPQTPGETPSIESLKDSLRRSLPAYMVPSRFAFLETLPTGVGGKLNRNALPDVESPGTQRRRPFVAPRNEQERTIAEAFARALGISEEISVDDDFFLDLGGDSLSAVGVICELRSSADGAAAAVRNLYEAQSAAMLAERLGPPRPTPVGQRPLRDANSEARSDRSARSCGCTARPPAGSAAAIHGCSKSVACRRLGRR